MAGMVSTGIWGFLTSAKKTIDGWVSTFVSGVSGWFISHAGDAEFKSIYARDKIVTNEYVYNRIRVTEDEEVVTSNGKILYSIDNEDGTWTVGLDLREGDINPFADGDLLQGYYHSPENSGVIYAVQKMTVQTDPNKTDQSMIVICEDGSQPYQHMIIVRVGNLFDTNRQSFIKISSRTSCQYFHDGINSFAALDNPDNVKLALGKADIGLIPAWAVLAVGNVRKWFGLIADGVILRGTFVLKSSNTTIEEEIDGMAERFVDVETKFEIREGQISSKITETEVYAENAKKSATAAAGSASAATDKLVTITEKESSINQTATSINSKVSEVTKQATAAAGSATAAAGSASDADGSATIATSKASEATQTAEGFQTTVTEATTKAVTNAVTGATELIEEKVGTAVTQSAKEWKVEVMGADASGNPNKILAAINASEEGIKISGNKVEITGILLAQIIMATGLNIGDKFLVTVNDGVASVVVNGEINATSGIFTGSISSPFAVYEGFDEIKFSPDGKLGHNFTYQTKVGDFNSVTINNMTDSKFNGHEVNIFVDGTNGLTFTVETGIKLPSTLIIPGSKGGSYNEGDYLIIKEGGFVTMKGFKRYKDGDLTYWIITNYNADTMELRNYN